MIDARASIWVGSVITLIVAVVATAWSMKRWNVSVHLHASAHLIEIDNPHAHHGEGEGN